MPVVISTAFDDDFFDEPVIESDLNESPCKRKCSKKIISIMFISFSLKNAI